MAKYTNEEWLDRKYRQIEALYRKGFNIDEIVRCSGLTRLAVLDITQKIFALDMKKAKGPVTRALLFFAHAKFAMGIMKLKLII